MKIVLSGIQATDSLTLGNYLGAIKNFIDLQKKNKMFIFVADLHALTIPFDPIKLKNNRKSIIAMYKACGLDLTKNIIFYQSGVIEHSHLAYILLCHTYIGELNRMTQFKDKSNKLTQANKTNMIPSGLLFYPTLMSADILLYDADIIPVGIDQTQHLELTRDLASRFNKKYKRDIFRIPQILTSKQGGKIKDLLNPELKMSKSSLNRRGTIFLLDDIEDIKSKLLSAKTDSFNKINYDEKNQPGVSNLINIFSLMGNLSIDEVVLKYENKSYKDFKNDLTNLVCDKIKLIQNEYNKSINDNDLEKIIIKNTKICKKIANEKIKQIHEILGLYYEN